MTARTLVAPGHHRGIRLGTGMPVLDAHADFQRARRAQIAARALHWLWPRRTRQSHPRALDAIRALAWTPSSLRVIALDAIVGTVDATADFDAAFRPTTHRIAARWQRIALAHRRGQALPPITAIEHAEGYYVIDGRHRVSVARALGHRDIEAWVSPTLRTAGHRPSMRSLTALPRDGDERWLESDVRADPFTTTTTST
jgi:hypothetical protein